MWRRMELGKGPKKGESRLLGGPWRWREWARSSDAQWQERGLLVCVGVGQGSEESLGSSVRGGPQGKEGGRVRSRSKQEENMVSALKFPRGPAPASLS